MHFVLKKMVSCPYFRLCDKDFPHFMLQFDSFLVFLHTETIALPIMPNMDRANKWLDIVAEDLIVAED